MHAFDDSPLTRPYLQGTGLVGAAITTFGATSGAETVEASDATAARIDELQLDLGVGPAWDAVAGRAVTRASELVADLRWPMLRDACLALGARSLVSFPVAFGGVAVGAVTAYAWRAGVPDETVVDALVAESRGTAMRLAWASVHDASRDASMNPLSRRVVHQATGMVLARFAVSSADAVAMLQAHAFAEGRSVAQVAADIVAGRSHLLDPDGPTAVDGGGEEQP